MKILWIALIICLNNDVGKAQLPAYSNQVFKINVGTFQFADKSKLVDKIRGKSVGLTYERFFWKHWSLSFGIEYCINNNPIAELKKTRPTLTLPEKEHRFGFTNEARYYLKKGGAGFYFSNTLAGQKVNNRVGTGSCPSPPIICNPFFVYNSTAIADRLMFGYQVFVADKMIIGLSFGYEFRFVDFYEAVYSPQIGLHFGFAK